MINLLPDDYKREIRAGRTNVLLARYIVVMLAGLVVIAFLVIAMYFTLNASAEAAKRRIAENSEREKTFSDTRKAADQFRSDLSVAKTILDNDIRYSKLIYKISAALPKGVVLDSLNVDTQTLGTSVTINASATSYANAVALKNSFEEKTDLFSDVHFDAITYNASGKPPYLYQTSLAVVIDKEAL